MLKPQLLTSLKNYNKSYFGADLFAGVTVGIVALPLAMAFAIASGVGPERGLFTAIVAGCLVSLLGGSTVQIGGPTGAFVLLVSAIVAQHGYDGLVCATIMAGILLIVLGLGRLGTMIKFVPFPVTTGFTTGIALVIFSTQIKDFLGLRMEAPPAEFIDKWHAYVTHFHTVTPCAPLIGLVTIAVIVIVRKRFPRLPAMLFGMIAATVMAWCFNLDVETIGSRFGDLPRTLPAPALPSPDLNELRSLIMPAFTIAMLAAIESLLSASVADGMIGTRHRSNVELIAQGVANIASAAFGGIPATGAIARTATNIKSGAKTPVAGIIHAITLALVLLFLAPLARRVPLAGLAAILMVVSYNMSEMRHFVTMFKAPRSDAVVMVLTFLLTVLVDLTTAVQIGLVLAAFLFMRRMSEVTNVGMITRELADDGEDGRLDPNALSKRNVPAGVEVFEINGPFFFGAAEKFKEVTGPIEKTPPVIILRMRNVPAIDATGLHVLREMLHRCRRESTTLILSGVHAQPLFAMQKCGLFDEIGEENALGHIDDALNRAREILGLPPEPSPVPFVPSVARDKHRADSPELIARNRSASSTHSGAA